MPDDPELNEARRMLNLTARHAFGHAMSHAGINISHADPNVYAFVQELERFIEAKIDAEVRRWNRR